MYHIRGIAHWLKTLYLCTLEWRDVHPDGEKARKMSICHEKMKNNSKFLHNLKKSAIFAAPNPIER